jgi:hypothetical protein
MADKLVKIGGAAALLAIIGGCAQSTISGSVARSHCGVGSHDVANLDDPNPQHAYWCKSDNSGYLGEETGQGAPRAIGRIKQDKVVRHSEVAPSAAEPSSYFEP